MSKTLNIRMDSALKERGNKVLYDNGITATEAVRALWQNLSQTKSLPDFLVRSKSDNNQKQARIDALAKFAGVGKGKLSNLTDEEMTEIYNSRFEG